MNPNNPLDPSSPFHPRGFVSVAIAMGTVFLLEYKFGATFTTVQRYAVIFALALILATAWRIITGNP